MRGSDLLFDPVRHRYTAPDGRVIPSVTQILRATGVSTNFEALPNQRQIALKRDIGTALHADAHAFDDDDIDEATVHEEVRPYYDAWKVFRANYGDLVPIERERILFHEPLWFCGTMDGIFGSRTEAAGKIRIFPPGADTPFLLEGRTRILIDLKTGDPDDAGGRYQLAGYKMAWEHEHPGQIITARWAVELVPERKVPYRVHPYDDDWLDQEKFRSIVTTFYARSTRLKELQ
jgi:hypothetical protein